MCDELVKSLRLCTSGKRGYGCTKECAYWKKHPLNWWCIDYLIKEAADAIEELSAKVSSLQIFADNISKLPDCNTCLKKNLCEFMPKYGEYCRINCPAWLGEPPSEVAK